MIAYLKVSAEKEWVGDNHLAGGCQPGALVDGLVVLHAVQVNQTLQSPRPDIWNQVKKADAEVGNYKRKIWRKKRKKTRFRPRNKERFKKKERKHAFDQEIKKETKISTTPFFLLKIPTSVSDALHKLRPSVPVKVRHTRRIGRINRYLLPCLQTYKQAIRLHKKV